MASECGSIEVASEKMSCDLVSFEPGGSGSGVARSWGMVMVLVAAIVVVVEDDGRSLVVEDLKLALAWGLGGGREVDAEK